MSGWVQVKLGEISTNIQTGPFGSQLHQSDYEADGVPVIMPKDIVNGAISETSIARIGEQMAKKLSRHKVVLDDIVYPRRGDVAKCAIIGEKQSGWLCGTGCLKVTIDKAKALPLFIYYQLQTPSKTGWIEKHTVGATMPNLNTGIIGQVPIDLPTLNSQCKITDILFTYDNLIDNYRHQIKLLEEAAQRLYKEWFVDLRFPGHEHTKIVDGVPEGWERRKAVEFFDISIGKTPPRKEKQWFTKTDIGIPWVSISDMKDVIFINQTEENLTQEACDRFNIKIIPKGTILLSFKLTVGRVSINYVPVCTNEAIAHFWIKNDSWRNYTFFYLTNYNYDTLGNTSGISKAINSTIVKNMPFIMPEENTLTAYDNLIQAYVSKIELLQNQITLLTEARDRLLPKLMSGEIKV